MRWSAVAAFCCIAITQGSIALAEMPMDREPIDVYMQLRDQALKVSADSLQVRDEVFGVVMETAYPEAIATLVSLADGTTSLYFSTGGGVIGAGHDAGPAAASRLFASTAASHTRDLTVATSTPLPKVGYTRFYVLTQHGTLTAEAKEQDLGEGRHALSPLFYAGQDVITEIRKVEEAKQ